MEDFKTNFRRRFYSPYIVLGAIYGVTTVGLYINSPRVKNAICSEVRPKIIYAGDVNDDQVDDLIVQTQRGDFDVFLGSRGSKVFTSLDDAVIEDKASIEKQLQRLKKEFGMDQKP